MRKQKYTVAAAWLLCLPMALVAQQQKHECGEHEASTDRPHVCEVRDVTIPAMPGLEVDAGKNGGVSVQGSDRGDIAIHAVVLTWGNSEAEARELQEKIRIATDGGRIHMEGVKSDHVSVSFKIAAPHNTSIAARAENGGIALADLNGKLRFETTNGGLSLANLAGDAKGETTNGGVHVVFDGTRWNGSGIDVRTTNGGVHAELPANYAAHLEASTVNGGLRIDVPVEASGKMKNSVSADIGGGGPTVHLETVNGGVSVQTR